MSALGPAHAPEPWLQLTVQRGEGHAPALQLTQRAPTPALAPAAHLLWVSPLALAPLLPAPVLMRLLLALLLAAAQAKPLCQERLWPGLRSRPEAYPRASYCCCPHCLLLLQLG